MATVERRHGGVDVLVNNAGVGFAGSLARTSRVQWDKVLTTNLTGPFASPGASYVSGAEVVVRRRAHGGGPASGGLTAAAAGK